MVSKPGSAPGTVIHIGEKKLDKPRITLMRYNHESSKSDCFDNIDNLQIAWNNFVNWVNIDGIYAPLIEKTGKIFNLHPLVLEDVANTFQRPKFEDYHDHLFIVLKMLSWDDEKSRINTEQVSIIITDNTVISIQEARGDVFDQVRERIKSGKGKIRNMPADYLAHCLIDSIVDNYFLILEKLGEKIESLEQRLFIDPQEQTVLEIHSIKRELILLRKSVWPLRELVNSLQKSESMLMSEDINIYFANIYDHTIQIIDTIESFRDMTSGMLDIYLSSISNKMNAVMKVLTIIATIFIPLSFITGVFGMNFENMPELKISWMYPVGFWLIIAVIILAMLIYFKRKKWL
jgi:magnesium transporter